MGFATSRGALLALALGAAGAAPPAAARVLDSSPAGFTVENVVIVPVTPSVAWDGLVNDVDQWWPKDHSWFATDGRFRIEPRAGGCFCEVAGRREALHMIITFADPGSLLRMVGGLGPLQGMGLQGALEWRLKPVAAGTQITLRYVAGGYAPEPLAKLAPVVDRVQGQQLGGLAAHLGAKPDRPK